MGFDNKFFLGVVKNGYTFLSPPKPQVAYTDEEMIELAALIITTKPQLQERFEAALKRMQE